jgi:hypothetical protein
VGSEYSKMFKGRILMRVRKSGKGKGRYYIKIRFKNEAGVRVSKIISLARYVWSISYPNDPIKEGESVHHIDLNPLNNDLYNLIKMNEKDHHKLHKKHEHNERIIKKWRKTYEL